MTRTDAGPGEMTEADLKLRLQGLQHDVEKSAGRVRKLAIVAVILFLLLVLLLISLHLYRVMQYATVEDARAMPSGRAGEAEIRYKPKSAGKIEFVRESDGLVQTLTEYADGVVTSDPEKKFTWSGKPGEQSRIHVTYRQGLFLTTRDLPVAGEL